MTETGRRESRRAEAQARQARTAGLTPTARLQELDNRLGKGIGAQKERQRLRKLLERLAQ